jgi:transcriptional regulator with XRE-family HTH domain
VKAHFGEWLKKVRERLGLTQSEFAALVGLDTYMTVRLWERSPEPKMRGIPREGLLSVLALEDEADLNSLWRAGAMPDITALRQRVEKLQSLGRQLTVTVRGEIYEEIEARAKKRGVPIEREAEDLLSGWVANYRDFRRIMGEAVRILEDSVPPEMPPRRPDISESGEPGGGATKSSRQAGSSASPGNGSSHGGQHGSERPPVRPPSKPR